MLTNTTSPQFLASPSRVSEILHTGLIHHSWPEYLESFQPIKWKRGKTTQTQKHRDTNTAKQQKSLCGFNALALLGHYVAINVIIFRAITKHQTSDWQIVSSDQPLEPSRMNLLLRSKLDILECFETIIGGSCHKYYFCRDKHVVSLFVATNMCFSRQNPFLSLQNYVCRDKYFSWQVLSRQKYFFATNIFFFATKLLSRQAYFCRDKRRVLSRQKWYLWQLPPMIQNGVFMTPSSTQSLVPPVLFTPTHYKTRSRRSRQTKPAHSTFG